MATVTARKAARSGALWGYVFGIVVASSALSYDTFYKTAAQRARLAATYGTNHATTALFGPAPDLQSVAGFTVFKSSMVLMVVGAVWGLLTATRLLRGEEEAGRWELLVAGPTTRRRATAEALGGLGAGVAVLWAVTAVITAVAGRSSKVHFGVGAASFLALAMVSTAVVFLAIGAVTSQLAPTRRRAAADAAVVLGVAYALRMVADAGVGLHALVWASPLGWVEELRPLTAPDPVALLPLGVLALGAGAVAVHLAGTRDLGASTVPDHASAPARLRWLSGPTGLSVRLVRPAVLGWLVALALTGLLVGVVAESAGRVVAGSSVHQVFGRLGVTVTGTAAYLGICFLIVAVLVAFLVVGQVSAARAEEAEGRLEQLVVRPVSRSRWLGGRGALGAVAAVAGALVAGLCTWLGAASQHGGVGLGTLLAAGLNTAAPALFLLGLGWFALGCWPRVAPGLVYAVLTWSLLVEVVGGVGTTSHWLLDTSLFHQIRAAPADGPDWSTNAVLVGLGLLGALAGGVAFGRRDLVGE